ncbi:MAG: hypothetical protein ACJ79K_05155 [Gemmatimonadaceae bacterium]
MPKASPTFDLTSYTPVAERIRLFYERYPAGRIVTELVSSDSRDGVTVVTFRALAFRAATDAEPAATGWASERDDDGEINAVACLENAETSAIGRALANLGFATSTRPSREEMEKAQRGRARIAERAASSYRARTFRAQPPVRELSGRASADSVAEVDSLAAELERAELETLRIRRLRQRLARTRPTIASLIRVERVLRHWLARLDD